MKRFPKAILKKSDGLHSKSVNKTCMELIYYHVKTEEAKEELKKRLKEITGKRNSKFDGKYKYSLETRSIIKEILELFEEEKEE